MKKSLNLPLQIVENKERGQVALVSVLILFAIGTLITISGVLTTLDSVKNAHTEKDSSRALYLADGCLEEGYFRYKKSDTYTGSSLNVNTGSCIITVTGETEPHTITSEASVGEQTRTVQATVTRVPFSIETWEEIP